MGAQRQRTGRDCGVVFYYNLTPVFSVVLAFLILGERMTAWQALGAAVVIAGVYLTRRNARASEPA
jgi:probable blue pigment (indigoidine) exporter